ncbi:MAG TPA: hypothetical protein VFM12_03610 [Gemmatimonadales bacterium]|nr:hypothetical protein [Gemmatimonadales bacterium]
MAVTPPMRTQHLALLFLALACGDDSSRCELPPGRYAVHAFDPSGVYPDRDFVQLNAAPTSCDAAESGLGGGAYVEMSCSEVSRGQFFCSGQVLTAAVRFEVNMRGPL